MQTVITTTDSSLNDTESSASDHIHWKMIDTMTRLKAEIINMMMKNHQLHNDVMELKLIEAQKQTQEIIVGLYKQVDKQLDKSI